MPWRHICPVSAVLRNVRLAETARQCRPDATVKFYRCHPFDDVSLYIQSRH